MFEWLQKRFWDDLIMAGGDCVKATFMEYLNVHGKNKDQYKYVVVLRETFGIENYNFHCLLKKTNPADGKVYMIDASNSAKMVSTMARN
jgi:hypothetical protein